MSDDIPDPADLLARGVARMLRHMGYVSLPEFRLRSGRRADVAALNGKGEMVIVENTLTDPRWRGLRELAARIEIIQS